jgi:hypothetical protein
MVTDTGLAGNVCPVKFCIPPAPAPDFEPPPPPPNIRIEALVVAAFAVKVPDALKVVVSSA